jgi:hypothetical protein
MNSEVEQLLWQVVGMNKRSFWIIKRTAGMPRIAACTYCGERFTGSPDPLLSIKQATDFLVTQFDQHECEKRLRATRDPI